MGDRTYVNLTVQNEQADQARAIIDAACGEASDETDNGALICFGFEEVNYATLDCEGELQDAGIAYDKQWAAGGDYGAGSEYCRFTPDGQCLVFEVYDEAANPDLDQLLQRIDDPAVLRAYILDFRDAITPLPWKDQLDYGRLYALTRRMLGKEQP